MARIEIARYEVTKQNAQINASASETFFSASLDQSAKSQWGSFNNLEIVNDSSIDVWVDLDGLTDRRRKLFAKSTMVIKAEQGIFWDTVKVTNTSSTTAISANSITLIGRIVRTAEVS